MNPRLRWLLGGAGGVAIVIVIAAVAIAGGGDDDKKERSAPTTTTSTSTTTTTTLAPVTTAATTPVTVGIICTTPEDAAMSFVNSWLAGDRGGAQRCATLEATDEIFQTSGAGAQYTWQGCFGDPGVPTCAYTYEGGSVNFTLNGTEASGWKVVDVNYVAD